MLANFGFGFGCAWRELAALMFLREETCAAG